MKNARGGGKKYLIRQGWHNMAANRMMTVACIGVLTACLIITGIASLLSVNVNRIMKYLSNQNEIVVYLLDTASDEEVEALGNQLQQMENVESVRFVSKEEALEQMQDWMEEYGDLLEGYGTIFPATFRVTVSDLALIDATTARINDLHHPAIEKAENPSDVASVMVAVSRAVTLGGWSLVTMLALVSIIVINNTIRLTVFNRRREIMIMKYVGATNGFIRLPFFVEGMTVGAIAGLISSAVVIAVYVLIYNTVSATRLLYIRNIVSSIYSPWQLWYWILAGFVLFGIVVGGIGTATSVRKHLRV